MESDNDSDMGDMLDDLLANAGESSPKKNTLRELNFNFLDSQENATSGAPTRSSKDNVGVSLVREADVDSSDDEDKRDFESQNYSDCGRDLKNLLKKENTQSVDKLPPRSEKRIPERPGASASSLGSLGLVVPKAKTSTDFLPAKTKDVYSDPIFGLRLVKPLISSAQLVERMRGRTAVTVSRAKSHLATENTRDDWVIAGVLINRSATKTSQKGSQYCIWKLSDLSEKLSTVSVFLFSGAYKLFWKTTTGTVVGVLNPSVMESRDDADEATLSVDNAQKIMILGNSRDIGKCKSSKKNGEPCSNIVNLSRCEYCVYHVKQEYGKASRRADIQSNASGRGFSSSLGQKKKAPPAGIYAQGLNQNFTPVLAKRNQKLYEKDSARLALLKGATMLPEREAKIENPEEKKKKACAVELTTHQVKKDLERLNKLRGWNVGGQQINFVKPSEASSLNPVNGSSPVSAKSQTSVASVSSPKNSSRPSQSSKTSRIASISSESQKPRIAAISSPRITVPRLGSGVDGIIDFSEPVSKNSSTPLLNSKTRRIASISPESHKPRIASISSPKKSIPPRGSGVRDGRADLAEPIAKNSNSPSQNSKTSRIASISSTKVPRLTSGELDDFSELGSKKSSSPSLNSKISRTAPISSPSLPVPCLGAGLRNGSIDFSEPITKRHVTSARLNAMRWIKENGNLRQSNPNKIRESKEKKIEAGAKRRREVEEAEEECQRAAKKAANGIGDKFKEIMEAKSAHVDLVEKSQDEEKEKYFEKLEIKERMEEKMMTTFKVDCKAVKCLICKYTSFSASDLCKEQKHPLRVMDAVKSFFKCSDCGNRTVSLDRIPSYSCKKCSGSHWVRAAMMDEKKSDIVGAKLSIRGGEEKFIGSVANDANINLCVPDSGTGDS